MEIGSKVVCIVSFEELRKTWGFNYPRMGEVLTISEYYPHPYSKTNLGIMLLEFHEKPDCCPICDKTENGEWNFIELEADVLREEFSELVDAPPTP